MWDELKVANLILLLLHRSVFTLSKRETYNDIDSFLDKMGQAQSLFCCFRTFKKQLYRQIVDFNEIRTRIVEAEGKNADHLTTTTTAHHFEYYV